MGDLSRLLMSGKRSQMLMGWDRGRGGRVERKGGEGE